MLKCSNCGADLKIDDSRMLKYCPYCGREVEMDEQVPDTVMGVMRSFGKSLLSQRAEQKRYEREHASEIAEEKRKTTAPGAKNSGGREPRARKSGSLAIPINPKRSCF